MEMNGHRRIAVVAVFLTFHAFAAMALPSIAPPLDARITLKADNIPLGSFLEKLSARTKSDFLLASDLDESTLVSMSAKDQKADEVLLAVLDSRGLVSRRVAETGVYVVLPKARGFLPHAEDELLKTDRALDARIAISIANGPLNGFFEMISSVTKTRFVLSGARGKNRLTVNFKNVLARDALEAVLEMKNLEIARDGENGYTVRPAAKPAQPQ